MGQRPSYAGRRPIGRPELASRFRDENETTTVRLNNRINEGSTEKIPVDARGDYDLVNRLQDWPREHRPFWLLNAEAIEAHRNQNILQQQFEQRQREQQQQPQQQTNSNLFTQSRIGSDSDSIPIRSDDRKPTFAG